MVKLPPKGTLRIPSHRRRTVRRRSQDPLLWAEMWFGICSALGVGTLFLVNLMEQRAARSS